MFKKVLFIPIFLGISCMAMAQTLHLRAISAGSGYYYMNKQGTNTNAPFVAAIQKNAIILKSTAVQLNNYKSFGISPDKAMMGVLHQDSGNYATTLFEEPGKKLIQNKGLSFGSNDPSLKVYPLNNGRIIVRSNIAHFDIYNPEGALKASFSNGSGSLQGESISRLVTDYSGETIIVYNPKINKKGHKESRIQRVDPVSGHTTMIYYNSSESIKDIQVSHDGQFLAVLFENHKKSHVVIMDLFGNKIHSFHFDNALTHIAFSNNDRYITMVQGNSVTVYHILSGKKAGAAYLRGYDVTYANYIPADHAILGIGSNYNKGSDKLNKVEFSVVDLKRRKIASRTYSGNLTWYPETFPVSIDRLGRDHYRINGFSSLFRIKADF